MELQSIKIRGATGIKKGLGLDEINLDLSGLSGLIALSGPNGKGKSTLLENLSPYPTLASRKGALSHHFFLRDSFRDLTFTYQGDEIRTLIKVDHQSAKTEGFAWVNGNSQVDGKITNYKEFLKELLGSPELFFNSVFCAQNSPTMTDLTKGELQGLFSEFLRLDRYIKWENTSKQAGLILQGSISTLDRDIERQQEFIEASEGLAQDLTNTSLQQVVKEKELAGLTESLRIAEDEIKEHQEVELKNKSILVRVNDLEERKEAQEKTLKEEKERSEAALERLRTKRRAIKAEIDDLIEVLKNKESIEAAVKLEKEFNDKTLPDLREKLDNDSEAVANITSLLADKKDRRTKLEAERENLRNDSKTSVLRSQIETLEDQTETLDLRDNDPNCPDPTAVCVFVAQAVEAKEKLGRVQADFLIRETSVKETIEGIEKDLTHATIQIRELEGQKIQYDDQAKNRKEEIRKTEKAIEDGKGLTSQAGMVQVAESKLEGLKDALIVNTEEGLGLKAEFEERLSAIGREFVNTKIAIKKERSLYDSAVESEIDITQEIIKSCKYKIKTIEGEVFDLKAEIANTEGKIKAAAEAEERLKEKQAERDRIIKEISEWAYLKDACSKDGLRALETNAVLPRIMLYSNELTTSAFGPDCTIKIVDQNEEGKEIFDIKIIDEDGEEVLLSNRSGGQQIWPLKALRLAMARISKEKSGRNFQTLLSDEEDGGLDIDNAMRFVSLYRAIITPSRETKERTFENCFFISHKEETISMADHVIEFGERGIEIN